MDSLGTYLELINTVAVQAATASVKATADGSLSVTGGVGKIELTAGDGQLEGLTFEELDFGVEELSLPSAAEPGIRAVPVVKRMVLRIAPAFYKRLARVVKEPLAAQAHQLVDQVVLDNLRVEVRLSMIKGEKPAQILDVDVQFDKVTVLCRERVCVTVSELALTIQGFDLSNKNKKAALAESLLVIHRLRVEVEEHFLNKAVDVGKAKAPDMVQEVHFELPGRKMIVNATVKVGMTVRSRVDLRLEAKRNLFGIYFDKFYLPGLGLPLPGVARNAVLGAIKMVEKKLKGLVEVSDERLLINPWPKIPVPVECMVERFEVSQGKVVVAFGPVPGFSDKPAAKTEPVAEPDTSEETAGEQAAEPSDTETAERPAPMMPPGPPPG